MFSGLHACDPVKGSFFHPESHLCLLVMSVSDVRDYMVSVENDRAEAIQIAEGTAQSAPSDSLVLCFEPLTRLQGCSHGKPLY